MAFTDYKNLTILKAKHPQIIVNSERFIPDLPELTVENSLKEILDLNLKTHHYNKFYIEENLVSVVLRHIWHNNYMADMNMWSHQEIEYNEDLSGIPDYMFTQLDQKQYEILSHPVIMVIEAVEYSFVEGWAKCIAQMLACQKLNTKPNSTIFGIVTTGKVWEFAKLEGDIISKNIIDYDIFNLPKLVTVLDYLLGEAKKQL